MSFNFQCSASSGDAAKRPRESITADRRYEFPEFIRPSEAARKSLPSGTAYFERVNWNGGMDDFCLLPEFISRRRDFQFRALYARTVIGLTWVHSRPDCVFLGLEMRGTRIPNGHALNSFAPAHSSIKGIAVIAMSTNECIVGSGYSNAMLFKADLPCILESALQSPYPASLWEHMFASTEPAPAISCRFSSSSCIACTIRRVSVPCMSPVDRSLRILL